MVLSDYLKSQNIDNDIIKDITLIEPSRSSLIRCLNYLGRFYDDADINPYLIDASHFTQDYIKPIFSYILISHGTFWDVWNILESVWHSFFLRGQCR